MLHIMAKWQDINRALKPKQCITDTNIDNKDKTARYKYIKTITNKILGILYKHVKLSSYHPRSSVYVIF